MKLSNNELAMVSGGSIKWYVFGGIASFLAGIISGFFNPKSCNR